MITIRSENYILSAAYSKEREQIYKARHAVYAGELQQHQTNDAGELRDELDDFNHYIVAKQREEIVGFISITPPSSPKYSVDKYFDRSGIPYEFDDRLYEIRLLTVMEPKRNGSLAHLLMYAAFRWVQSHGGKHIVSICRADILDMYKKAGLTPLDQSVVSGKVTYELCVAEVDDLQGQVDQNQVRYKALQSKADWKLPFAFFAPSACYHGGAFFQAIGEDLQQLEKIKEVINADVLDAWFPPSPKVLDVLQNNLPWLLQTSPPTHAGGLINVISGVRGVSKNCILPGAGSSDLIFLALRALLSNTSRVLIIDPCYGEYVHVLEKVVQCQVVRFTLNREEKFRVDTEALLEEARKGYDMVILVNPNSPTGVYIPKEEMGSMLEQIPSSTIVWVDETYIEYTGSGQSLEKMASRSENVIVCKSMSKVYALSGVRAAYLCCAPHLIETLKPLSPPWAVSLPAQAAAITALKDEDYYKERYLETHYLRKKLMQELLNIGAVEVIDGVANFLLFYLPPHIPVQNFIELCREENLFLRDVSNMGRNLGASAVRIAVKDEETNNKMISIMQSVITTFRFGLTAKTERRNETQGMPAN